MPANSFRRIPFRSPLSGRERIALHWSVALFVAILADGALRKWVLPLRLQAVPYFAKDVLAALFLFAYPHPKAARWAKKLVPFVTGIGVCLGPAFLIGVMKVPAGAVVVMKNAVLWPLVAIRLGSYMTQAVAERLSRLALISTILMAVLGVIQYFAGPASLLNRYAWEDIRLLGSIATAGEYVRATGTFSFLSGLASFSMVMFCLFLGKIFSAKRWDHVLLGGLGVAGSIACGLVTGSRATQLFMAVVMTAGLTVIPKKHGVRLIGGALGAGVISVLLWNSSLAQGAIDRWDATGEGEVLARLTGARTGQPIGDTLAANPAGFGLGFYTGISAFQGSADDLAYNENGANRVAAEAGIPGYVATLLGLGLIVRAARWTLAIEDKSRKTRLLPIAIGASIHVTLGLWYDHASTALWWWMIALWLGDAFTARAAQRRGVPKAGTQPPPRRFLPVKAPAA